MEALRRNRSSKGSGNVIGNERLTSASLSPCDDPYSR